MQNRGDIVHSIDNAIYLLDIIMANRAPMSLKEIAAVSHFPKSTIHGYLNTLRKRGIVGQDEKGNYLLGNHLFEFGMSVFNSWDFVQLTNPILAKLTQKTGKSSILSTVNNDYLMNVNFYPSPDSRLQIAPCIGTRIPFHATAQGKTILAGMDNKKIRKLIGSNPLKKYTDTTITDPEVLYEEIRMVREKGVAFVSGEYKPDNHVISVPVKSADGDTLFALAVMEKIDEVNESETDKMIHLLKSCAEEITKLDDIQFENRY